MHKQTWTANSGLQQKLIAKLGLQVYIYTVFVNHLVQSRMYSKSRKNSDLFLIIFLQSDTKNNSIFIFISISNNFSTVIT